MTREITNDLPSAGRFAVTNVETWTVAFAAVGAFASCIAAITGVASFSAASRKNREERNAARKREADRWTVDLQPRSDGLYAVQFRYDFDGAPDIFLQSVRITSPRGALFRAFTVQHVPNGRPAETLLPETFRKVTYRKKLTRSAFRTDSVSGRLQMPARSWWTRVSSTRIRFALDIEELSAARRQTTITVTSEDIHWTALQTASSS